MNRTDFLQFHKAFLDEMHSITIKKNADYGGGTEDAFYNFRLCENYGIDPLHGFMTRMLDKFSRLASFVKKGELQNESVKDTLLDLANYSILLAGYIEEQKETEE